MASLKVDMQETPAFSHQTAKSSHFLPLELSWCGTEKLDTIWTTVLLPHQCAIVHAMQPFPRRDEVFLNLAEKILKLAEIGIERAEAFYWSRRGILHLAWALAIDRRRAIAIGRRLDN